jgi:hypothetical protein
MAIEGSFVQFRQLFLLYFVFHFPLAKRMPLLDVDVDFDPYRLGANLRGSLVV